MIETLKDWDTRLFLYLNSKHNTFLDPIMYWASDKLFWIPFYLILFIIVVRSFKKRSILVLLFIAALITASDQLASGLIKNWVKRPRPSHALDIEKMVHLSSAGAGGPYGFVSSHASNSFSLFIFLSMLLPASFRPLKWLLFFWAMLVSYSRIYNGVHYPGDVLVGGLLGAFLGFLFAWLFKLAANKWMPLKPILVKE